MADNNVWQLVDDAARRYNIDPSLARALVQQESGGQQYRNGAVLRSDAGALGVMQLMPGTARQLGVDPNDMAQNIDGGMRYLRQQLDAFGGNEELALAAYNAGPGAVQRYNGIPPYRETQNYVRSIMANRGTQVTGGGGNADSDFAYLQQLSAAPAPVAATDGKPETAGPTQYIDSDFAALAALDPKHQPMAGATVGEAPKPTAAAPAAPTATAPQFSWTVDPAAAQQPIPLATPQVQAQPTMDVQGEASSTAVPTQQVMGGEELLDPLRSAVAGTGQAASSIGGFLEYLNVSSPDDAWRKHAAMLQSVAPQNPTLGDKFIMSLPSSLALMVLPLGATAAAGRMALGAVGSTAVGALGVGASRAVASAMEAGGVYRQMIDAGKSVEQARQAALQAYRENLALYGLDAGEYAIAFGGAMFPALRGIASKLPRLSGIDRGLLAAAKFIASAGMEGAEEVAQTNIGARATGMPASAEEYKESFILGALTGGAFQTVATVSELAARGNIEQVNNAASTPAQPAQAAPGLAAGYTAPAATGVTAAAQPATPAAAAPAAAAQPVVPLTQPTTAQPVAENVAPAAENVQQPAAPPRISEQVQPAVSPQQEVAAALERVVASVPEDRRAAVAQEVARINMAVAQSLPVAQVQQALARIQQELATLQQPAAATPQQVQEAVAAQQQVQEAVAAQQQEQQRQQELEQMPQALQEEAATTTAPAIPMRQAAQQSMPTVQQVSQQLETPPTIQVETPATADMVAPEELPSTLNAPLAPASARVQPQPITGQTPKKLADIILDFGQAIGRRVRIGKTAPRSIGTYYPGTAKTVVRYAGNLSTTAHEMAHALDDQYNLVGSWAGRRQRSPFDAELFVPQFQATTLPSYNLAQKRAEAVAEWMRAYAINPQEAQRLAPQFYQHFVSTVPAPVRAAIDNFGNDVRTYAGATPTQQAIANVAAPPTGSVVQQLKDKLRSNGYPFEINWYDKLQYAFTDQLWPALKAVAYGKKLTGNEPSIDKDPEVIFNLFRGGTNGKIRRILLDGMVNANGDKVTDGGIDWLLEPFNGSREAMDSTIAYMIAQRTLEKAQQLERSNNITGIGAGLRSDVEVANDIIAEINANPALLQQVQEAATRYRTWSNALLRYMVDSGRMSEESYNYIVQNNQQYVALYAFDDPNVEVPQTARAMANKLGTVSEPIATFKGGSRQRENPYVGLIQQTDRVVREADRNRAMRSFVDIFRASRGMYDGDVQDLAEVAVKGTQGDPNTIRVYVDGKPEYWQFHPDVFASLKGLDEIAITSTAGKIIDALARMPGTVLRETITQTPPFIIRNVPRDIQHKLQVSNIPIDSARALMGLLPRRGTAEQRRAYEIYGGAFAGNYQRSREAYYDMMAAQIREFGKQGNVVTRAFRTPAAMLRWWNDNVSSESERAGRQAEYNRAYEHARNKLGYNEYQANLYAANEARGVLDYARAGLFVKWLNRYIPFTNASVQAFSRNWRGMLKNPVRFATMFTLASVLPRLLTTLWNMGGDEDDRRKYMQLPPYQRLMFLNFHIGDNKWLRIPTNFEIGVAAAAVENTLLSAMGAENIWDGYAETLVNASTPLDASVLVGGPLRPIVEAMINRDTFRDKYIVPPYEEGYDIDDPNRHTERASILSQLLMRGIGLVGPDIDARKIDHVIAGMGGNVGRAVVDLTKDRDKSIATILNGMTGIFGVDPAAGAPDVQYVNREIAASRAFQSPELARYNQLFDDYYAATTDEDRAKLSAAILKEAQRLRQNWDSIEASIKARREANSSGSVGGGLRTRTMRAGGL